MRFQTRLPTLKSTILTFFCIWIWVLQCSFMLFHAHACGTSMWNKMNKCQTEQEEMKSCRHSQLACYRLDGIGPRSLQGWAAACPVSLWRYNIITAATSGDYELSALSFTVCQIYLVSSDVRRDWVIGSLSPPPEWTTTLNFMSHCISLEC